VGEGDAHGRGVPAFLHAAYGSGRPAYLQRTEWNVRDSDGTVVFTFAREATGGSLKTIGFARKHGKPCIHTSRAGCDEPALTLQRFAGEHGVKTLNVAGSRENKEPGIHQ